MTSPERTGSDGVRAARALLSLVEEHSADDFQAAEAILGGQKELAQVLQLLRDFKRQQGPEDQEPVSIEGLREIVKKEVVELARANAEVEPKIRDLCERLAGPLPNSTLENTVEQILAHLDDRYSNAAGRVLNFAGVLRVASFTAGPAHRERIESLLRGLAISAIAENVIMLPTLHSIAQLRTMWAPNPLPYKAQESRQHLAERLIKDAERLASDKIEDITTRLLAEGLRGPADRAIAETRRRNKKAAHGE
ncbi:uncharacterized protein SOCEGT47_006850 [Sorangium cellulosum]|uniref:Uncharacterized protein n=1 Tax=Sorangium cellulosum TaxID=56 RepID=A0A4P2PUG0_SORCE|nr:hypothetical protein [Sorangium cellulosum]AUX20220.1 uncharacterized protein SOCEGT47_006850 [Sorangium cellulosum]